MNRVYTVQTDLGTVQIMATDIRDARARARSAFWVGPRSVTRYYAPGCRYDGDTCDSNPCCCETKDCHG